MLGLGCVLFVLVLALNQIGRANLPEKIYLTVYYESQCPDSRDFIVDQLQPALNLMQKSLSLKMVPFGKADSIHDGYTKFNCQHGPSECLGNLVQDCALEAMRDRPDLDKVSYVTCEMDTEAGTTGDMHCVNQANIPVEAVQECVSSRKGVELQLFSEYLTKQVKPKFIPTVTFDGTFNQNIQDTSMGDLIGTLCSIYKNLPPCAQHYNNMAMMQLYD